MGPSGCGKSTLLNVIGMLDSPTSGSYVLNDQEVAGKSEADLADVRKKNIGFIFQSFNLVDELSVRENIELALLYHDVPAAQRKSRVDEVMDKVGIAHRAKHRPSQLSGGQQQRVAVARALVGDPKLILADEPTGNLDTQHGEEVMKMLQALNREGSTIIMVTHSPAHADYAGRVVNMLDGRVLQERRRAA
jgi:putative ABC transport system ATP-binding protein